MDQVAIAAAYEGAAKAVEAARMRSSAVSAVWAKLNRVGNYLQAQAKAELAATLEDSPDLTELIEYASR